MIDFNFSSEFLKTKARREHNLFARFEILLKSEINFSCIKCDVVGKTIVIFSQQIHITSLNGNNILTNEAYPQHPLGL